MKHILRAMMLVVVLIGATSKVLAATITKDGVTLLIEKAPNDAAGNVDFVGAEDISGTSTEYKWKVTIKVKPSADYGVNKNTIKAEKMVAASSAPRRTIRTRHRSRRRPRRRGRR